MADYDLGDTVALGVDVRNSAGTLVNASSITLTITLPDGTTTTPAVSNPSTGRYEHDYTPTQAGRHTYRFASTGPATAFSDVFDVAPAARTAIFGLAAAKKHLNIPASDTTYDEELRDHVDGVTGVIEGIVGAVARRTVVETRHGRGAAGIALLQQPVISVTSVTEDGVTVDAAGYRLSDAGVLYRVASYTDSAWSTGRGNIVVTYVAGRAEVSGSIRQAAKELLRINWRPQQGGNYSPFDQGRDDDSNNRVDGQYRLGFYIPNRVMQQLEAEALPGGSA